jgi:phosphate butyryltransferase
MILHSHPLSGLTVGQSATQGRLVTADDLYAFASSTGNHNPANLPDIDMDGDGAPESLASGAFCGALVSAVLGTELPGPGTLPVQHQFRFHATARAGEDLVATVTVTELRAETAVFAAEVRRLGDGALILSGTSEVRPPAVARRIDVGDLPGLTVRRHRHFDTLIDRAAPLPALRTALVWPSSAEALVGAMQAAAQTIIAPLLVGDEPAIRAAAAAAGIDLAGAEIVAAATDRAAAARAVALVHEGRADAVMKGHLHTDDLLRPVMERDTGLRIGRRLTHVFVMDVPGLGDPLLVTDAAINIAPDLPTKVDIVQNAIDLALSLGIAEPRVGVLSAVETVNPAIPSSLDAALLSKMAERGQITGGLVDGPLAMDNAVDMAAARTKGLRSAVAGQAQVLVVPGIDAGNMLAKQLTFLAHAEAAGLVLGAKVPVILTSRADSAKARLASCAVAAIHFHRLKGLP